MVGCYEISNGEALDACAHLWPPFARGDPWGRARHFPFPMLSLLRNATLLGEASNSSELLRGQAERCPGAVRWGRWPSPVGLSLGILAALAAQILVICYHYVRLRWCATRRVQPQPRPYEFWEGIKSHLANPGGIVMMVAYLCASWMFDVMPCSYYSFEGGVRWWMVFAQTCSQDFLMFLLHYFEHKGPLGPDFYQRSHKPHHKYLNPRLFDAFDGSVPVSRDTSPPAASRLLSSSYSRLPPSSHRVRRTRFA